MSDDFKSEMKNQVTWTCKTKVSVQQEASSAKKRKKRAQRKSSTPQHEPVLLIALQDNSYFLRNSMCDIRQCPPCQTPTQWVLRTEIRNKCQKAQKKLKKTSDFSTSNIACHVHSLRLWSKPWKHTKVMPLAHHSCKPPKISGLKKQHTCRRHASCFCCFVHVCFFWHYRSIESHWIIEWYWMFFKTICF